MKKVLSPRASTARADLGDNPPQLKPQPQNTSSGVSCDNLTLEKVPVKKKRRYYHCDEPSCEREFYTKSDLANHKRCAHGADRLNCLDSNCPASFASRSSFLGHMWVKHDIGKGPKCDHCGKKEPNVSYLRNHLRAAHGAPKLQCKQPGCIKVFTYDIGMFKHMKKKHT